MIASSADAVAYRYSAASMLMLAGETPICRQVSALLQWKAVSALVND